MTDIATPAQFREHFIGRLPGAYQCAVADINGDGKPDVIGVSSSLNKVVWYENPSWREHMITSTTHGNIDAAAYALDGPGKMVIAVASEFDLGNGHAGGRLQLYRPSAHPADEWVPQELGSIPTAHRLRWIDWDGDGHKELVVVPIIGSGAVQPEYAGPAPITTYRFSGGEHSATIVDHSLNMVHGARVLDWNGSGRESLLTASFEGVNLFQAVGKGEKRQWSKQHLCVGEQSLPPPHRGSSEVDRGWLKGHKPFIATIEPWHGNEVVVYTPGKPGELWTRQVIDTTIEDGHALVCVDLDGDGVSEIVAGGRGGPHRLYGYRCIDDNGEKWERFIIDDGDMGPAGIVAIDMNGDGRTDLVCAGSATANVKWYENLGAAK